jgi:hypothetical protein
MEGFFRVYISGGSNGYDTEFLIVRREVDLAALQLAPDKDIITTSELSEFTMYVS